MTQDDRDLMGMACCLTCLLSEAMKDCPRCEFYPYKVFKALASLKAIDQDYPEELRSKTFKALQNKLQEVTGD